MKQRRFNEAPPVCMISCRWDWNSKLQRNKPWAKYLKEVLQIITLLKTFPTQNVSRGTIGSASVTSFHRVHLLIVTTFIFHRWYEHKWTCGTFEQSQRESRVKRFIRNWYLNFAYLKLLSISQKESVKPRNFFQFLNYRTQ